MRTSSALMAIATVLCVVSAPVQAFKDDDVFGIWRDVESGGLLQVYPCAENVCIKIAQVAESGVPKDAKNPDRALRDRPLLGVVIMADGKKSGPTVWDGNLYNTQDGGTYKGSVKLVSENEIKLSGCVMGGLICASRVWQKMKK